jgi:phage protein D
MSAQEHERSVAAYEITVNGNRIPPEAEIDLIQLEIAEAVDEIGMFALSLNAGEQASGAVRWVDDSLFREGNELRIKLGYSAPLSDMMVGDVTAVEPEFPATGPITLTVRGYDRLHRLAHERKTRSFKNMTDSDIASQIAQERGLTADVEATRITHEYLLQNNQTDMEFMQERAALLHYELRVQGTQMLFRSPGESAGKALTLTYGQNLVRFSPRISISTQAGSVRVQGWSAKQKQAVTGQASSDDVSARMGGTQLGAAILEQMAGSAAVAVVDAPPMSQEEADTSAKGRVQDAAFGYVTGDAACLGDPSMHAGTVVELLNLGQRFSGLYYVTSATHRLSPRGGYTTAFSFRRSAT